MKKCLLILATLTASALLLGGCFRKHIESAPPVRKAAPHVEALPAPTQEKAEEQPEIIEETYVVDAPEEAAAEPVDVGESELAEEPLPALEKKQTAANPADANPAAMEKEHPSATGTESVTDEAPITKETTPPAISDNGMYYIQIGAFSDLENANRVLARLLSDGYKDSVLSKTDSGLFRVQAGTFPDETSAEDALSKLRTDYPEGFVFKKDSLN